MKKRFLNRNRTRLNIFCVPIIILLMGGKCEGNKSMYLINCSSDVAIIKSTPSSYYKQLLINDYNNEYPDQQSESIDSIIIKKQIDHYKKELSTESNIQIKGDSMSIELKPGESIRLALTMWIFYPGRIREPSLSVDNLIIITKSDTCFARDRKEILQLQKDKRFKYDNHYKDKIGSNTRQNRKILIK